MQPLLRCQVRDRLPPLSSGSISVLQLHLASPFGYIVRYIFEFNTVHFPAGYNKQVSWLVTTNVTEIILTHGSLDLPYLLLDLLMPSLNSPMPHHDVQRVLVISAFKRSSGPSHLTFGMILLM